MVIQKGVNRYPRLGERIAPATLRQGLLQEAPPALVASSGVSGLRLCDLDETVWSMFSEQVVAELARTVVARVSAGCAKKTFDRLHFPRPPVGVELGDLRLEHRTHACLARAGFESRLETLGDQSIGRILAIRAFGPRCLVDLLASVESLLAKEGRLNSRLTADAERLAKLPEASSARRDDPRFGPLIKEVDADAQTAKELADRLLARSLDPPDPSYAAEKVQQLEKRILAMPGLTLEEELIQIFATTANRRNGQIVAGYYGWRDGRCHTLARIGARYGMTRERTRQICAKLVKREHPESIPAPVMDRTLNFIKQRLPLAVATLEGEMLQAGLTAAGLKLENVETSTKLLGRAVPFVVVPVAKGRLAVNVRQAEVPGAVVELAKKEVYYHGLARIEPIREALTERFPEGVDANVIVRTVELLDGFRWLDEQSGWFRLVSVAKHGLPRAMEKILSVAPRISAAAVRKALKRNRRTCEVPPPENVILEFCRQTPGVRIENDRIMADPPLNWRNTITGVEAKLVEILEERGPVMERGELEDTCIMRGMNRFSFHAFIASSPVISQYGHSVYGLLEADVSAETVKSLIERRRAERAPVRVLRSHDRTPDGKVQLAYRLSKAASTYAVITVPAELKEVVSGKFKLLSADGRQVGTLAAKDGRAWGLGAYLRRNNAQTDDRLVITLDLENQTAVISLGEAPRE